MKKIIYIIGIMFYVVQLNATFLPKVDCIILEDENSIVCKYSQKRVNYEKHIIFDWIEPDGKITRTKELIIPAGHGSIYDYRYIKGRTLGTWTFKVTDNELELQTTFTLE